MMGKSTSAQEKPDPAPKKGGMVQTALWLPREMHERLKKAGGARGLGEEIRRRLEASFTSEGDQTTRELLEAIASLANTLELDDPWHQDAYAFRVFESGVSTLLSHYQPSGDGAAPRTNTQHVFFNPQKPDPPDMVGRLLAGMTLSERTKRQRDKP